MLRVTDGSGQNQHDDKFEKRRVIAKDFAQYRENILKVNYLCAFIWQSLGMWQVKYAKIAPFLTSGSSHGTQFTQYRNYRAR